MFDIHFRRCNKYQIDMIKAYLIVNNREFKDDGDDLCFYADKIDDLFSVVEGLDKFFQEHKRIGCNSGITFVCTVEDGTYCLCDADY